MPLILTQNEITVDPDHDWKDVTGQQYHFPNQYRNVIREGERFVYYRGLRRSGNKRGTLEYFGYGVIGEVWRDPETNGAHAKRDWAWYCRIEDYVPFSSPVPARVAGEFIETVRSSNHWRWGVRSAAPEIYVRILQLAGASSASEDKVSDTVQIPELSTVTIPEQLSSGLIAPVKRSNSRTWSNSTSARRYSRVAKAVGDRAEAIVYEYLQRNAKELAASDIVWRAKRGELPGWDIDYRNPDGDLIAVEVKGSTAARVSSLDLTANEWNSAQQFGKRYQVFVVTDCLSESPRIERIVDPHAMVASGALRVEPVVYELREPYS